MENPSGNWPVPHIVGVSLQYYTWHVVGTKEVPMNEVM